MSIKVTATAIDVEFVPLADWLKSFPIILEEADGFIYLFNKLHVNGKDFYTYSMLSPNAGKCFTTS
jgi:hypothetical protein